MTDKVCFFGMATTVKPAQPISTRTLPLREITDAIKANHPETYKVLKEKGLIQQIIAASKYDYDVVPQLPELPFDLSESERKRLTASPKGKEPAQPLKTTSKDASFKTKLLGKRTSVEEVASSEPLKKSKPTPKPAVEEEEPSGDDDEEDSEDEEDYVSGQESAQDDEEGSDDDETQPSDADEPSVAHKSILAKEMEKKLLSLSKNKKSNKK